MPVVLRYVLEFASTTAAAVAMLRDIPVHMSYSIAVIDRQGNYATVYVNPDRPAEVVERCVGTFEQSVAGFFDRRHRWRRRRGTSGSVLLLQL
nr:carcinine hydrolase/isopenicillin-N N-acyltransferase family protein [Rhizobium laguerreae]